MFSGWSWLAKTLFGIAFFGTVTSGVSLLLALLGGLKFRAKTGRQSSFTPPISVLKPVHGAEKGQSQNLRSFFELDYPEFELIFCARTLSDPAILCAQELANEFPHIPTRFIASGEPLWTNPKVFSMSLLTEQAQNEIVCFCDSDIRVKPDYLRQIVQPLADPEVGLVTCAFRGKPAGNIPSLLTALIQTVEFSGGVLTANFLEDIKFALGSTLLTRKTVLNRIGGFEPMQDVYADDFSLGNRTANCGYKVILSTFVVDHFIYYRTLTAGMHHQIVWMKSTRRSRPAGHLGIVLTYAMPFGVLGLLAGFLTGHVELGCWIFLIACINRWIHAIGIGYGAMRDSIALKFFWLFPLCDLLDFYCWFVSNFGNIINYRGRKYRFIQDGRIAFVSE